MDVMAPFVCSHQLAIVAASEKPTQASKYPATKELVLAKGRPTDLRFSVTRPKIITVGVTEGNIIANIMTAHITNIKTKSNADHASIIGIAIPSPIDMEGDLSPR